jgi:hypothetical protein
MLQVSDAYKELVKSNIRPKCEPIIKVFGIDNTGKEINLIWNASNIKDLKYKRGVDVIGRELPFMELTWTEIYTGKLNAENYPEKYNNITNYMEVELSFVQDLSFYNTWKTLYKSGTTWEDIYLNNVTWKQIKNQTTKETIYMPKLVLSARPSISGNVITWNAKDVLYFLDNLEDTQLVSHGTVYPIWLANIIDVGIYGYSPTIQNMLEQSVANIRNYDGETDLIGWNGDYLLVADSYKNVALNFTKLKNGHITFKKDGSFIIRPYVSLSSLEQKITFNIMINKPQIEFVNNISSYSFRSYTSKLEPKSNYEVKYSYYLEDDKLYFFEFPEKGEALEEYNQNRWIFSMISDAVSDSPEPLIITPYVSSSNDNTIPNEESGEIFKEDNKLSPFTASRDEAHDRMNVLKDYFKAGTVDISFSCLPILQYEPTDVVDVETNLYDENGKRIYKRVTIVSLEIQYNGAIKETIKGHEVFVRAG